jgi:glutamate/tyrosine decarboxylase-like PLP-dependent enzyme
MTMSEKFDDRDEINGTSSSLEHRAVRAMNAADPYREVLSDACARAQRYLETIAERRAVVSQNAIQNLAALGTPLLDWGQEPKQVLELLDDIGSPATTASMGRRFFGGVIGGALPATVAAHWLADAWDQNTCLFEFSPVGCYLEDVVLRWLVELFGLPSSCGGALVTGTQMADVTALAAARLSVLQRVGWDVDGDGLFGAPPISVIVGEEVHATMLKALAILGLGSKRIHVISTDAQGRMKSTAIPRLKEPVIVCTQVGNVNTGDCDPVAEICQVAHEMGAWVHVDGAFGLWAAVSPLRQHLVPGLALADSWATDAHKMLNVPQDSGIAIVRDRSLLQRAMSITAAYYPEPSKRRDPMKWGPESSRRARAVEIWAALRSLGKRGVGELVERMCQHAATFASGFRSAGYEVLNDVVLNQVLVSFGDDQTTTRIIDAIQEDGTCWCGGTIWKGRKAMRISVSSWATRKSDVEQSLTAMLAIARALGSQQP